MSDMYRKLYMKINTAVRYGMVHLLSGNLPLYVVNEYPRSGGHWVSSMLGRVIGVPFPSNRIPGLRSSIMHGHYLHPGRMKNVVVVWRDGRDVIVSMYYHLLYNLPRDKSVAFWADALRKDLPFTNYGNERENLSIFIEYFFTRPRSPHFTWADFVRRWHGHTAAVHVRYEDLRRDAIGELQRIVLELVGKQLEPQNVSAVVEEFSFSRLSGGRQLGQEDKSSFFRKGIIGDWRNYFSRESCQIFDHFAGKELILLGYERDRAWVEANKEEDKRISNV